MPELPEVETVVRDLRRSWSAAASPRVRRSRNTSCAGRGGPSGTGCWPAAPSARVGRRGKWIVLALDGGRRSSSTWA